MMTMIFVSLPAPAKDIEAAFRPGGESFRIRPEPVSGSSLQLQSSRAPAGPGPDGGPVRRLAGLENWRWNHMERTDPVLNRLLMLSVFTFSEWSDESACLWMFTSEAGLQQTSVQLWMFV